MVLHWEISIDEYSFDILVISLNSKSAVKVLKRIVFSFNQIICGLLYLIRSFKSIN